jgi:tetratricopeptide (TPR) repeat protein
MLGSAGERRNLEEQRRWTGAAASTNSKSTNGKSTGVKMSRSARIVVLATLGIAALAAAPAGAQGFGANKEKVTLQRKLPALIHLPGETIKVTVTSADEDGALPYDFQALLETELLKDDPNLRDDDNPSTQIICQITEYSHPDPTYTNKLGSGQAVGASNSPLSQLSKTASKIGATQRITGKIDVSFQAKDATGRVLISDNIDSTYDREFDSAGNSTAHGVFGQVGGTFSHVKGGAKSEDGPPTPSELRSRLIIDAVQQIAEHLVDSDENVDVLLARKDGPLEEGDKDAMTGLWERALETYETAPAFPKPEDDAYRLYDIGVAYEALAYQAEDQTAAMKYLDQAAINYGKAIDAKPDEKYFLDPQKRIETAIAHYKELQQEQDQAARAKAELAANPAGAAGAKGLTDAQVITMVKSGMDEATILQAIRGAAAVNFDLTPAGQKALTTGGVSPHELAEMKTQAAKKPAAVVHKGLNNTQIITMVKAGMEDETIIQTINGASAIDFDLSPAGQQSLVSSGVSAHVLNAMKARSLKKPAGTPGHIAEK